MIRSVITLIGLTVAHLDRHPSDQWKDGKPLGHKCEEDVPESTPVVYTAFYLWYGNPETDGSWVHWNHCILPHWDKTIDAQYKKFNWTPPDLHHSPYRPSKGLYSSSDARTLQTQFVEMKLAGIDVAVTSWWGRKDWHGLHDQSGANTDAIMQRVLDAAKPSGVKVAIHLEPYGGRDPDSVKDDIEYIHREYGDHPSLYKRRRKDFSNEDIWNPKWSGDALPVIFFYDVSRQHINGAENINKWRDMISSIRGTQYDAYLIGLYIGMRDKNNLQDEKFLQDVGFDAGYSYFASVGFTPATDYRDFNWDRINKNMLEHGQMDFIPSFGPGYNDTMLRPWNSANTQDRGNAAERYGKLFHHAKYMPHGLMVTSWNEWGEGTQIEPATPYTSQSGLKYMDYSRNFPDQSGDCDDCYLHMTKKEGDLYKQRFCEGLDPIMHMEL